MSKQKMSKKEIIERSIKTCEYLIIPVAGVAAIWGYDIAVYSTAFFGMLISILSFVELFIKE
jgi:hypothetical protein